MADDTVQDLSPVFEDTPHLGLPLPHPANTLEVDNPRLREALGMIDQVAHDMGQAIEASASQEALQALAQSTGQTIDQLQQQTEEVLLQQALRIQQLAQDIADKSVDLEAVAEATNAQQARAGIVALGRLVQAPATSATNGVPLEPGMDYALFADAVYSRPLPQQPQIGDRIRLRDPSGDWKLGRFTLSRGNADHKINGRQEDVVFNARVWRVELEYTDQNCWVMSIR